MERESRHDLNISGVVSASGGTFNHVIINGEGKINGDIDCIDFKINGVSDVYGNVKMRTGKINGKAVIGGNLASEEFKISGSSEIGGNLAVKEIKIEGSADIKGSVSAEEVEIKGGFKVKGDCEAEVFVSKGAFTIGGLLNAGNIDILLYGNCKVKEIGGEKINIRKDKANKIIRFIESIFPFSTELSTEIIEGDDIYLENTRAKVVRGNDVSIGPGCDIELVEYKNNFKQVKEAKVKNNKKV